MMNIGLKKKLWLFALLCNDYFVLILPSLQESTLIAASDKLNLWTSVGNTASLWCTTCVLQNALPLAVLPLIAPHPRANLTQKMKLVWLHTECRKFFLVEKGAAWCETVKDWAPVVRKETRLWGPLETVS